MMSNAETKYKNCNKLLLSLLNASAISVNKAITAIRVKRINSAFFMCFCVKYTYWTQICKSTPKYRNHFSTELFLVE